MDYLNFIADIRSELSHYPWLETLLALIVLVLFASLANFIAKRVIVRGIRYLVTKLKTSNQSIFARGLKVENRRISLHVLIFIGFLMGGLIASLLYPYLKLQTFLIPTGLSLAMSMTYWIVYFSSSSHPNLD